MQYPPSTSSTSWLVWALPAVIAASLGAAACSGNGGDTSSGTTTTTGTSGDGGSGGGTGGSGGSVPTPETARAFFEQIVFPGLDSECGACHGLSGSADNPFLAEPDPYVSITSWPGIVVKDPAKSILVVHPNEESHGGGQAPPISDGLREKCLEWLDMESKNLPDATGDLVLTVTPFKPILGGALNTVYLDEIDPTLQYASISFNAKELSSSLLQIKNLQVHPVEGQQIHIVHPLFTVYSMADGAQPDPVDSFSGVDQTFALDIGEVALGTGEIILTNWQPDSYLGIAFEVVENIGGGGPVVGCHDPMMFKDVVVPQIQYCADTCHGGANAQANATMDLSDLATDPESACAQMRARITPGDPASSQILIVTDPTQQAVHMYKFMGNKNKYTAFKNAVSPWIISEAQ